MIALNLNAWMIFVLIVLASARTFRLLAFDSITQTPRDYLEVYVFSKHATLKEGFYCKWCAGYWYALGWAATALAWGDTLIWQILAVSLAANYASAILNGMYDVVQETAEDLANES